MTLLLAKLGYLKNGKRKIKRLTAKGLEFYMI